VPVRKLPPESHQLRLALVLNGGVSLAIYMYGVTKELHSLARASATLDTGGARPDGTAGVYYDLLRDTSHDHPPISVVVDLIAGTSAGGINGVVLAKALATDLSIDPLESVWFDKGDIGRLILPDTSSVHLPGWGKRIWAAMHGVVEPLAAAANAVLDVLKDCAPLHGDSMSRWLFQALTAMDEQPLDPRLPLVPEGETLELLVTTTDMRGFRREISDQITGFLPPDVTFRQVFSFAHGADAADSSDSGLLLAASANAPVVNSRLAFAARSTSSFPGAFPPVTVNGFATNLQKEARIDPVSFAASFAGAGFPFYRAAGELQHLADREFIDGGVLDNTPFDVVIKSIAAKPSFTQVTRHIVYVQPVPPDDPATAEAREQHQSWSEHTGILGTLHHALITIPRSTSMLADLLHLQAINVSIEAVGNVLRQLDQNAETMTASAPDPIYPDFREIDERRDVIRALCRRLRFPEDSNPAVIMETALAKVDFPGCDFAFERRRRQVALQAVNQLLRANVDATLRRSLAGAKTRLYRSLRDLRGALDAGLSAVDLPGDGREWAQPDKMPAGLWPPIAAAARGASSSIQPLSALLEEISAEFGAATDALSPAQAAARDTVLNRLQQFEAYDERTLPITSLAGLPQLSPIRTSRFSPADVETLNSKHKLKGLRLGHFGGFFDRRWRKEDYLWGRLTAAEQVVRLVAGIYLPKDDPITEGAVKQALRAVFEEEPKLGAMDGEDIRAAREKAGL
jgi:predicted acylesterase/phospholipase RssA